MSTVDRKLVSTIPRKTTNRRAALSQFSRRLQRPFSQNSDHSNFWSGFITFGLDGKKCWRSSDLLLRSLTRVRRSRCCSPSRSSRPEKLRAGGGRDMNLSHFPRDQSWNCLTNGDKHQYERQYYAGGSKGHIGREGWPFLFVPSHNDFLPSFGFADHFGLSGDLRRVPFKAFQASVAGQSRWFQSKRISPPMWRSRKHSDCGFGHEREHFRLSFHADSLNKLHSINLQNTEMELSDFRSNNWWSIGYLSLLARTQSWIWECFDQEIMRFSLPFVCKLSKAVLMAF
jgi:hypothetical protein